MSFARDVVPHVGLGPVGQREDAQALARPLARIVEPPEFGALVLGVPAMLRRAEGEHALLGARFLLVAARAAEGRVELLFVERLLQRLGLHDLGVELRSMHERDRCSSSSPSGLMWTSSSRPDLCRAAIAKGDHLRNFHVVSTCSSGKGGFDG